MKIKFRNIALFILLEHLSLYILLMVLNKQTALLGIYKIRTSKDLFAYLLYFGLMPLISFILLSIPLYNLFKIRSKFFFIIVLLLIMAGDFLLYGYLATPGNYYYSLYKVIFGLIIFFILFRKETPFLPSNT